MNTSNKQPTEPATAEYESNPFKSCFNGLDRLFRINQKPAIVILIVSLISGIFRMFNYSPSSSEQSQNNINNGNVAAILVATALVVLVFSIISVVFTGIVSYVAYRSSKNESTTIGEAFRVVMDRFWTILGVLILSGLKIFGGLLLFIIPGIRAGLRYQMALFPVFDEDLGAVAAMKRIKELTKDHLMELFGIWTVASLVFPISTLLQMSGQSIMYPQLKTLKATNAPKPPVHWLNYIGFIVAASVMYFVIIILVLIGGAILLMHK